MLAQISGFVKGFSGVHHKSMEFVDFLSVEVINLAKQPFQAYRYICLLLSLVVLPPEICKKVSFVYENFAVFAFTCTNIRQFLLLDELADGMLG